MTLVACVPGYVITVSPINTSKSMVPTTSNGAAFLLFVAVFFTLILFLTSFLLEGVAPVLLRVLTPLGDDDEEDDDGAISFFAIEEICSSEKGWSCLVEDRSGRAFLLCGCEVRELYFS